MFFPSSHGFLHVPSISLGQILHFSRPLRLPKSWPATAWGAASASCPPLRGWSPCPAMPCTRPPSSDIEEPAKKHGDSTCFFSEGFPGFPCWSWFLMVSLTIWGTYTENRHTLGTLVVYHHFHFFKDTNFLEFHMSTGRENPKTSPAAHPAEFNARILSWSISRAAATWSGPFCVLSRKLLHR